MKSIVHCWKGKDEWAEEEYGWHSPEWFEAFLDEATCMLPQGHDGPHIWTPDGEIEITFEERSTPC